MIGFFYTNKTLGHFYRIFSPFFIPTHWFCFYLKGELSFSAIWAYCFTCVFKIVSTLNSLKWDCLSLWSGICILHWPDSGPPFEWTSVADWLFHNIQYEADLLTFIRKCLSLTVPSRYALFCRQLHYSTLVARLTNILPSVVVRPFSKPLRVVNWGLFRRAPSMLSK